MMDKKLTYTQDVDFIMLSRLVLRLEGGYVNNPKDPGGATNYGIAFNFNQGMLKQFGIDRPDLMMTLTKHEALEIYYQKYWLASKSNRIKDLGLAFMHFDCAVNQGVGTALGYLGRLSKNPLFYSASQGQNMALFDKLKVEYAGLRLRAYAKDRNRAVFLAGWVNRMAHVLESAFKMSRMQAVTPGVKQLN